VNEIDILKDISTKLEHAGISFMLSGSFAMAYYSQPRMTRDLDFVVELNKSSGSMVHELFRESYYISKEAIEEAILHESMFNLIHTQSVIKVDFIIRKNHEYRLAEFERREKITIADFATYIVSIEDLIISKLIWMKDSHSEMQKNDIKALLQAPHNRDYLDGWISKLMLTSALEELRHE
jgi:hypothetical protein